MLLLAVKKTLLDEVVSMPALLYLKCNRWHLFSLLSASHRLTLNFFCLLMRLQAELSCVGLTALYPEQGIFLLRQGCENKTNGKLHLITNHYSYRMYSYLLANTVDDSL